MTILDKLVERKDIIKYCEARIEKLKSNLRRIKQIPEKDRQYAVKKIAGRIHELKELKTVVHGHKERTLSTKYWEDTRESRESKE